MYRCIVAAYTRVALSSSFLVSVCKVNEEVATPSNGLRERAQSRLYGAAYKGQALDGISETDAQEGLFFAIEHPLTASQTLRTSSNYHTSSQESYGSEKAAVDISNVAKFDRKRQRRGEGN